VTAPAPRVPIGCLALLLGVLSATTAEAAAKRIGVPRFDGVQEALVRKKVMQVLKAHGYDLAKSREMEIGLANTGALLDNDEGFAKVAKELALAAIVTGEIGKKRAKISVHDGKDGSLLGEANFSGANPRKIMAEVGRDFWKKLGGEVERGKTPSGAKKPQKVAAADSPDDDETTPDAAGAGGEGEAEPAPEPRKSKAEAVAAAEGGAEGEEPPPPKKKKKKKKARMESDVIEEEAPEVIPPTFDAYAGPGFVNRQLAYNEDISTPEGLRPYGLPAGLTLVGRIVWFPIGPFTDGALKNLGVEANIEQAFLVSSSTPMGAKYGTSIHEFGGGLRYRMPFGAGHYFYGSLTGGEHAFLFKSGSDLTTSDRKNLDIPDTIYRFLRPGIGIHFELPAHLSVTLSGGYRWIFNKAGTQWEKTFFPYSSVAGVDAQVAVGYRLTPMFEVRALVDWRRYFSSMNCNTTNMDCRTRVVQIAGVDRTFVVGGAVDQYLSFNVVFAVTLGGTEIAMPEAEEPPPPPKRKRKVQTEEEEPGAGAGAGGEDEQ
jgi:hypothetical protein